MRILNEAQRVWLYWNAAHTEHIKLSAKKAIIISADQVQNFEQSWEKIDLGGKT